MTSTLSAHPRNLSLTLPFHCIRNISAPEDLANDRKIFAGQMPIRAIMDIPTDENVRDYLRNAEGKERRMPTQVHQAIKATLRNNPEDFSTLNSGVAIVAREVEIDEKAKTVRLRRPSIINGSQTQGVVRDYFDQLSKTREETPEIHIKFEIIVTQDEDLIGETSIARNFQNDVLAISIAGRRGQLDELQAAIRKRLPDTTLKMSETQLSDDYENTEKLLQVLAALTPPELWPISEERDNPNKSFTYHQRTRCLKLFQRIHDGAKDKGSPEHELMTKLYDFYLDVAAEALLLYKKWKEHQGFQGTGLRAIERGSNREIVDVPDGIVFPILAALSAFAVKTRSGWKIQPPEAFQDRDLIVAAKSAYQDIARSNPQTMGKSKACFTALYQITSIYRRLAAANAR